MEFNSAVKWLKSAQFQAPAAMQMSSSFFCDFTQPAEVIPYRRFETPYRYRLQVPSNVRRIKFQCWSTPNQPSGSLVPPQHHVLSAHQRTAILHYFAAQTPDLAQLPVLYQQNKPQNLHGYLFCTNRTNPRPCTVICSVPTAQTPDLAQLPVLYQQHKPQTLRSYLFCTNSTNPRPCTVTCSIPTAATPFNANRQLIYLSSDVSGHWHTCDCWFVRCAIAVGSYCNLVLLTASLCSLQFSSSPGLNIAVRN